MGMPDKGHGPGEAVSGRARLHRPLPPSVGFLPQGTYKHPAMIAKFGFGDDVHAVHLTYLLPDGSDKADTKPQRRILGKPMGWPPTDDATLDGLEERLGDDSD